MTDIEQEIRNKAAELEALLNKAPKELGIRVSTDAACVYDRQAVLVRVEWSVKVFVKPYRNGSK